MGIFLLVVGILNIWMCGAQCASIKYELETGNDVPRTKYALAVIDAVLGIYLIVASIGYFTN